MQQSLSPRLEAVAAQVPQGARLLDVGTDHAHLPIWLVQRGRVRHALAVDVAEGPLEQARRQTAPWASMLEVRKSDGLASVQAAEVDCITICGMGGLTISRILIAGQKVLSNVRRVVVQPQGMQGTVRLTMLSLGWGCVEACLIAEKKHLYVIESWEKSPNEPAWDAADLRWGRRIRGRPDPLYREWLKRELAGLDQGLSRLHAAGQADHSDAQRLRSQRIGLVREMSLIDG